jgi:hypothetical protein
MFNPSYTSRNGNLCLSNAQLAKGTTTTISTAAIDFSINDLMYNKAVAANFAPTACASQAAGTSAVYLVTVVSDGTVTVTKGTEAPIGSGQPLVWPAAPANSAAIGGFRIVNTTNAFISGTTAHDAAGVTATYYNFMSYPSFNLAA